MPLDATRGGWAHDLTVPADHEIEQSLLGALLLDNRAFEHVSDIVKPEHFYAPVHGRIFKAIASLINAGRTASAVTLKSAFKDEREIPSERDFGCGTDAAGAYLGSLAANIITLQPSVIIDHARIIADLHTRRELVGIAETLAQEARDTVIGRTASDIVEGAEAKLFTLADSGVAQTGPKPFSTVLTEVIETAEKAYRRVPGARGISTGLVDLDKKLGGLRPGELTVLAGRPGQGKSAAATNIAFGAAQAHQRSRGEAGARVLFVSLEMPAEQLGHRIVCQQSGIDSDRVRRGDLDEIEFHRFVESTQVLATVPLEIDETPALSVAQVRTRARRMKRRGGLGLIVIDYLQLLRGSGSKQSEDNRVNEISEITRGLKALAKDLAVPVLALSQISRQVEQRDDKRPMLSDLRESGSIEADADIVLFVFREEYYLQREEPVQKPSESNEKFTGRVADWMARKSAVSNLAELIIAKHRGGPTGTVKVRWDGPTTTFSDLSTQYTADYLT